MVEDPQFQAGVVRFNDRAFFEAHQLWEKVWLVDRGPSRDFYKGLIQIALGLHHFRNGNTRGARKLYVSCQRYLNGLRPRHQGVDLDRLMAQLDACCAELMASHDETPRVKLDESLLPRIQREVGVEAAE